MKIQLDIMEQTIKVEEVVSLKESIDAIEKFFPNDEWKKFKIEISPIKSSSYYELPEPSM